MFFDDATKRLVNIELVRLRVGKVLENLSPGEDARRRLSILDLSQHRRPVDIILLGILGVQEGRESVPIIARDECLDVAAVELDHEGKLRFLIAIDDFVDFEGKGWFDSWFFWEDGN